jgi:hypothetical protein
MLRDFSDCDGPQAYQIGAYMMEPTTGIEPVNLILTKDVLYLLSYVGFSKSLWSGKRDSNPRPSAWKADALAN